MTSLESLSANVDERDEDEVPVEEKDEDEDDEPAGDFDDSVAVLTFLSRRRHSFEE